MAFESISENEIAIGKPVSHGLFQKISRNFDDLNSRLSSSGESGIPNGSFEVDSNSDGIPDNWECSFYNGGSGGIDKTNPSHGSQCWFGVSPGGTGNGGMSARANTYIPCSPVESVSVRWLMRSSAAAVLNQVFLLWYKADKTVSGTPQTYLYNAGTGNPTVWGNFIRSATPPSDAAFFRVGFVAAGVGGAAGTTWFDGFSLGTDQKIIYGASVFYAGNGVAPSGLTCDGVAVTVNSFLPTFSGNPGIGSVSCGIVYNKLGGFNTVFKFNNYASTLTLALPPGYWQFIVFYGYYSDYSEDNSTTRITMNIYGFKQAT